MLMCLSINIICSSSAKSDFFTSISLQINVNWLMYIYIYIYIYIYYHHHHHFVSQARISLTLSRHFSLSFIASDRSSELHPVSSHSCCMYVGTGRPAFARPYVGVHRSTSLMSSSLLLQQCPACLVRLTWIVYIYIYIYIYILSLTDRLFHSISSLQCG